MAKKEIIKEEKKEVTKTLNNDEKKAKMIQICAISVGLIIVLVVVLFLTRGLRMSQEEKLNESLTKLGERFYTEFYYDSYAKDKTSDEIAEHFSQWQDTGIKASLKTISRGLEGEEIEEAIAKFVNDNGDACDLENTRAVIYPKSPYGKNDFTVKPELDCGFATEEK